MDINIKSEFYVKKEINKFIERSKEFCKLNKLKYSEIQSMYLYMKRLDSFIQKNNPNASISIEKVNEDTIKSFYESLKNKEVKAQEQIKINISPDALYKMQKDKQYALTILAALAKCTKPKSFNEFKLMLYDYNIFVKSNGAVEVVSCGDADYSKMSKERSRLRAQQAAGKAAIRERINALKSVIYGRYIYENNHLRMISSEESTVKFIPYEYFLNQNSELRRLMAELYSV